MLSGSPTVAQADTVVIGSDHAGYTLKTLLVAHLRERGLAVHDVGTDSADPVDYPDFAAKVALRVLRDQSRGILICGSGIGASVAANKFRGIRAGLADDHYSAHQGVEHDDMNVLVLGARVIGTEVAKELVDAYLSARFTGEERHRRRLAKIAAIEAAQGEARRTT